MATDPTTVQLAVAAVGVLHAVAGLGFGWIPMTVRDRNHMNWEFRALQGSGARKIGVAYLLVAGLAMVNPVVGILAWMVVGGCAWFMAGADDR